MLRSKWSSSTIGSIREEHKRRGPSAKLRLSFDGGSGKRGSENSNIPQTPESLNRTSYMMKCPRRYYGHERHLSREWDVMIIGYGRGNGVRRRGSIMLKTSDAGRNDSALRSTN